LDTSQKIIQVFNETDSGKMILILTGALSILSAFLFEKLKAWGTVLKLKHSYLEQFGVLRDNNLNDDLKQKELFKNISFQLKHLSILLIKLLISISPMGLLVISAFYFDNLDPNDIYGFSGIMISSSAFILYILVRKYYDSLFRH
jgi:hypothetical protein